MVDDGDECIHQLHSIRVMVTHTLFADLLSELSQSVKCMRMECMRERHEKQYIMNNCCLATILFAHTIWHRQKTSPTHARAHQMKTMWSERTIAFAVYIRVNGCYGEKFLSVYELLTVIKANCFFVVVVIVCVVRVQERKQNVPKIQIFGKKCRCAIARV